VWHNIMKTTELNNRKKLKIRIYLFYVFNILGLENLSNYSGSTRPGVNIFSGSNSVPVTPHASTSSKILPIRRKNSRMLSQ